MRLGRGDGILVGLGIEAGDQVAGLDGVALVDLDLGDAAVDAEAELDLADIDIAVERRVVTTRLDPTELGRHVEPPRGTSAKKQ